MIRCAMVLFLALLITSLGCGKSKKGVVLMDGPAYLQLRGACEGVSLQVDDSARISMVENCDGTQFSIKPGLHVIKLYKGGGLVLERKVSLGASETYEVRVP